jgi:hypothetical protein
VNETLQSVVRQGLPQFVGGAKFNIGGGLRTAIALGFADDRTDRGRGGGFLKNANRLLGRFQIHFK